MRAPIRGPFRTDDDTRAVYSETAGIQRIAPIAVAAPIDVDDLAALVEWARAEGLTLTPRGSGTSMTGAATGPGVVVDLSRWNAIDTSRFGERIAVVGPGAVCNDLNAAALPARLRFPVDPSSAAFCTIGGMTATNAAGAHTLAFGATRAWITGIEVLLADGTPGWTRRGEGQSSIEGLRRIQTAMEPMRRTFARARHDGILKNSSGYGLADYARTGDLVDLLVGSEGTLAFSTRVEVRLATIPAASGSIMGIFPSLASAAEAAVRAKESGAVACELLDRTFLDFVATASGKAFDASTEAVLLAEVEGESGATATAAADQVAAAFARAGATESRVARTATEAHELWTLRHAASPILARLDGRLKSMQFIEDGAVPPARLPEYIAGVRAAFDRHRIRGVIFGHAGDAHAHVNALIDVTQAGWRQAIDGLLDDATALVASLGGTISGEHGDGRIRTPFLDRVWDVTSRDAFVAVKKAFDPHGLLNPGVVVPGPRIDWPIKYDPSLPPHPARARQVLRDVEATRSYSKFRFDLIDLIDQATG